MSTINLAKKIRKAVIPVAGLGTRMLPATKTIPKEMLPLVDKPLIQYVVNECIVAGINEIVLVTHSSKNSIENHFDTSFELESVLAKRVKRQLLAEIKAICPPQVTIMQIRQGLPKGLGHAIMCARPLVGEEPVAVILPDVIINEYESNLKNDNLAAMLKRFEETGHSQILIKEVENVTKYGIVNCQSKIINAGDHVTIVSVVEKPTTTKTSSHLSIVGRYIFSAKIWSLLEITPAGINSEINLTDTISMLINKEKVEAYYLKGISHDCGNKLGYVKAFVKYALHHNDVGYTFRMWLKNISL